MAAKNATGEVITLQVGNYSNFVGAHFWNFQEALIHGSNDDEGRSEINHGILYREGLDVTGERTYKPRVICFDLKGSISTSQECSDLSPDPETSTWEGTIEKYDRSPDKLRNRTQQFRELDNRSTRTHQADSSITHSPSLRTAGLSSPALTNNMNTFQDNITSWLEYSLCHFHDKSLHIIDRFHDSESNFGSGERLFRSQKFQNDFEDRLHFFAEECDRLQGFQIFSDIHNGFGGLTSGILQELTEEYSKKSHLCFATMPAVFPDDSRQAADQRILNILLGFARYVNNSNQTVPVSLGNSFGLRSRPVELPWIDYKATTSYHTSAILATAIDTVTLPHRLTNPELEMMGPLTESISVDCQNISALSVGVPVPVSSTFTPREMLKGYNDFFHKFTSLTPDVTKPSNILSASAVIRGVPCHLLKKSEHLQTAKQLSALLQSEVKHFLGSHSGYVVQQPCLLTPAFPNIFKSSVTPVGCVVEDYQRPKEVGVQKISVMTSLQNCDEVRNLLEVLSTGAKQANIKKYPGFLEEGIELEDIKTSLEDIDVMAKSYHHRYEL